MDLRSSINAFLDGLPCPRLGLFAREVPTFRACGIVGFYVALLVLLGGGLLTGRSLVVLAALALVSGLSFFVYTYLRMWITGREELVLLEHVWFALACNSEALWWMGEPILPYLDIVSVALCPFLAAGRVGCTLVGCCHGRPSSLGIAYNENCARDGFSRHLVGVRLLPVPAIEAMGLVAIGATGFIALPFASPGHVFAWYLIAYSVMRFGLEGARGDYRPHFLLLSQARWMALLEVGLALHLTSGEYRAPALAAYAALFATLVASLAFIWRQDRRRSLLTAAHLGEIRQFLQGEIAGPKPTNAQPKAHKTSCRVTVAVSRALEDPGAAAHVSLSLPDGQSDLPCLCELAVRVVPELIPEAAQVTSGRVIHLRLPSTALERECGREMLRDRVNALYGSVVRRCQNPNGSPQKAVANDEDVSVPVVDMAAPAPHTNGSKRTRPWYFTDVDHHRS